jgi:hypothetical protein
MWIAIETANVMSNDDENMHRIIPHLILVLLSMMNCAVSIAVSPGDRVGIYPAISTKPIAIVSRHSVPLHAQNL